MDERSFDDRIEQGRGKAKEWAGRATGDRRMERQGRLQSGLAGVRVKLRGAAKDIGRIFRATRNGRRSRRDF